MLSQWIIVAIFLFPGTGDADSINRLGDRDVPVYSTRWTSIHSGGVSTGTNSDAESVDVESVVGQTVLGDTAGGAYSLKAGVLALDAARDPLLFANGFEAGDTAAWDASVPN